MSGIRLGLCRIGVIALVGWVLFGIARGDGEAQPKTPPAPAGVKVSLDKNDKSLVEGTIAGSLRITTDYGPLDLNLAKVKYIDFAADNGHLIAIVELEDKTHMHGEPVAADVLLTKPDGRVETVALQDVRELKVLRDKVPLGWLAFLAGLVTLSIMEIVLGVDNVIFLAIIAGKLPKEQQPNARRIGLAAALGTRLLLLFSLSWLLGLTKPVFTLPIPGIAPDARDVSWRDLILIVGGGFLIVKSVMEMHHKLEEAKTRDVPSGVSKPRARASFASVIAQIAVIDIVFSLDSVITAVGMVDELTVMILAMIIAMGVMLVFAGPIAHFVEKYPTIKVLALSFLILIGVLLVAEGLGQHIEKGYVYFAMAFGVGVELVNLVLRPKGVPELIAGDKPDATDLTATPVDPVQA